MENIRKQQQNKGKPDDSSSSSDSDSSVCDIGCDICGMNFPDVKTYENHVKGKKHHKMVTEVKFMSKHIMSDKKKKNENKSDDDEEDSNEIHCEVCDKYVNGHKTYIAHMRGSVHAKNMKKEKLKKRMVDMPEVLDKEDKADSSDSDGILPSAFARCATCQKEFSGPEPFNLHLKSTTHKKKVQQSKSLKVLKTKYQEDGKASDDEDYFSNCTICNKSFSGPVPYHMHMRSNVHKKSMEKMKIAEEMKEFLSSDNPENGYVCKECKKTFTDPKHFKFHLKHNSHEKQKAKNALSEFLASYPEILFVTLFEEYDQASDTDSDNSDQEYYLICKICHVCFSGPESAQDHVKSKKHLSVKKEKKMLKVLKQQKKRPNNSAELNEKEKDVSTDNPDIKKSCFKNDKSDNSQICGIENLHLEVPDDFEII